MSTDSTPASLVLPARLDRSAAIELKSELDAHLGGDITIDGAHLEVIGGLGLQVVYRAQRHWAASGWQFEFTETSDVLSEALSWLDQNNQDHIGEFA